MDKSKGGDAGRSKANALPRGHRRVHQAEKATESVITFPLTCAIKGWEYKPKARRFKEAMLIRTFEVFRLEVQRMPSVTVKLESRFVIEY